MKKITQATVKNEIAEFLTRLEGLKFRADNAATKDLITFCHRDFSQSTKIHSDRLRAKNLR